jgi:hypothetical protein
MNTKNILVSFLLIASVLLLTATASAYSVTNTEDLASKIDVKVDGVLVADINEAVYDTVSVVSGDEITVKVTFTANASASNVRIRAELEGDTEDTTSVTSLFDVENGKTYVKTLTLKVPAEFKKDELSNELALNLKIWNSDYKTEVEDITLNVQRSSYDVAIKSIMASNTVSAGETMSIDVVLKNAGYNDVDDVYVTVSIPELGIEKSVYFGDLVNVSNEDEDEYNTVNGRIYLDVPYSVESGLYTLQVEVEADESTNTATREITIDNGVSEVAIKSGEDLILLNPTNRLTVYTVKYLANEEVVVVPADSSKTVIVGSEDSEFDVTVYSGDKLVSTVKFGGSSETTDLTSPVFVLTVVLAIVFLVLLVVLVVLLTKKPAKAEEFGESYY